MMGRDDLGGGPGKRMRYETADTPAKAWSGGRASSPMGNPLYERSQG